MPSTKDLTYDPKKLLFIGPNGRGKTIAAASAHLIIGEGSRGLFLDFDGRMAPVKARYPNADIQYETFGPRNFLQFREFFDRLMGRPEYSFIVVDSVTSLSMTAINYQLGLKGKGGPKGKEIAGIQVTTWDEINGETTLFSSMLDALKMYPGIVIVTAHPVTRTTIDENEKRQTRKDILAYGPKVSGIVPNYFNEIYSFHKQTSIDPDSPPEFYVRTNDEDGKTALPLPGRIDWTGKDFFPILHELLKEKGIDITK